MSTQNHHYFASFGMGFKMALTRDEAIQGLVAGFRREFKPMVTNSHKQGEIGAYIWTCKVPLPMESKYDIEWFAPKGVGATDPKDHFVTYVTAKQCAYFTPEGTAD